MHTSESITLNRSCEATEIPSGIPHTLSAGVVVSILQSLGGSYTVTDANSGRMYRIDAKDADALGFSTSSEQAPQVPQEFSEELVWNELKTVYDPEIPVNIVDLGLIYSCVISPHGQAGYTIDVKMSLTAPGCGMADVLKADVERKLSRLPHVAQVHVEVAFDPPWHHGLMSDAAKLQLGFDLDYNPSAPAMPIVKEPKR